jgi:quercetin dioxygenase-like cupin family protein
VHLKNYEYFLGDKIIKMKKERKIVEPPFIKVNRLSNASQLCFDFPVLINKMKLELASKNGEPKAKILLNYHEKQIMLTVLHESTEINSFQGNDSISIQVIEGKLKFHTRKGSVKIEKGQILKLYENIKYSYESIDETVFILIIENNPIKPCEN